MKFSKNIYKLLRYIREKKLVKECELKDYSKETIETNMMIQNGLIM